MAQPAQVPGHGSVTQTIAQGAQQIANLGLRGRKVVLTGYPLTGTAISYFGYDNTVSATNFAFFLKAGDIAEDQIDIKGRQVSPDRFWMIVDTDNAGVMMGIE